MDRRGPCRRRPAARAAAAAASAIACASGCGARCREGIPSRGAPAAAWPRPQPRQRARSRPRPQPWPLPQSIPRRRWPRRPRCRRGGPRRPAVVAASPFASDGERRRRGSDGVTAGSRRPAGAGCQCTCAWSGGRSRPRRQPSYQGGRRAAGDPPVGRARSWLIRSWGKPRQRGAAAAALQAALSGTVT